MAGVEIGLLEAIEGFLSRRGTLSFLSVSKKVLPDSCHEAFFRDSDEEVV